jgi:hypothetical protein
MQTGSAGARAALAGLWTTPPPDELGRLEGRWARRGDYTTKLEAEGEIE